MMVSKVWPNDRPDEGQTDRRPRKAVARGELFAVIGDERNSLHRDEGVTQAPRFGGIASDILSAAVPSGDAVCYTMSIQKPGVAGHLDINWHVAPLCVTAWGVEP